MSFFTGNATPVSNAKNDDAGLTQVTADVRTMGRLSVYFDGSCPLCTSEICFYQRQSGGDIVDWVDVSRMPDQGMVAADLSKRDAMARFHVRRADGSLLSGAAAFAELWQALPVFRFVGGVASLPGVVHLLELAYRAFLPVRPIMQRWIIGRMQRAAEKIGPP